YLVLALLGTLALPCPCGATPQECADVGFFETKIRPVLVESCHSSHTVKKAYGGLALLNFPLNQGNSARWLAGGLINDDTAILTLTDERRLSLWDVKTGKEL